MHCPSCDHTMNCLVHGADHSLYWCAWCGTLRTITGRVSSIMDYVPKSLTKDEVKGVGDVGSKATVGEH